MKLTKLYFENYKAFAGEHELELRPLTILIGRNNSGKSALARLPLLLRELCVDTDGADILRPPGKRLHAMFHGQHDVGHMTLGWQLDTMEEPLTLGYDVVRGEQQVLLRELRAGEVALKIEGDDAARWLLRDSTMRYSAVQLERRKLPQWSFIPVGAHTFDAAAFDALPIGSTGTAGDLATADGRAAAARLKPLDEALKASDGAWPQLRRFHGLYEEPKHGASYVDRADMENLYNWAASRLYDYRADKSAIFDDIRRWYRDHLDSARGESGGDDGYYLEVEQSRRGIEVMFKRRQHALPVHLVDSGAGIGQSLPIVVYCHMLLHEAARLEIVDGARPRQSELLIVEEPESHLHPGMHGALAELFIKLIKESSHRAIVETHSEVFCLRMQRRIAEKKLSPDDVVIYWVDQDPKLGRASITPIFISEKGETYIWRDGKRIRYWPRGVFSEDFEEIQAIQELANS